MNDQHDIGDVLVCVTTDSCLGLVQEILAKHNLLHKTFKTKPLAEKGEDGARLLALPLDHATTSAEMLETVTSVAGQDKLRLRYLSAAFFESKTRKKQLAPEDIIKSAFEQALSSTAASAIDHDLTRLKCTLPRSYTIYGTLLLLPPSSLTSPPWQHFAKHYPAHWQSFLSKLATKAKVTNIAILAPIPPKTTSGNTANIIRSPSLLLPLHGSFGPAFDVSASPAVPTASDFAAAYWTSTVQNGVAQTWAPRHTMFSAGNIREKARLLSLPSVTRIEPCTVVDLYVGIGYFAFSYLRGGAVDLVLGWDLNPWSLEGLRRGAVANGWAAEVRDSSSSVSMNAAAYRDPSDSDNDQQQQQQQRDAAQAEDRSAPSKGRPRPRVLAFCENNVAAAAAVARWRSSIPPIRHVNCGLLPTSRASRATAVRVLDPRAGGCIHVHENFALREIAAGAERVRREVEELVVQGPRGSRGGGAIRVVLEEVFRVKSYAPGVWHCVVDVRVDPGG